MSNQRKSEFDRKDGELYAILVSAFDQCSNGKPCCERCDQYKTCQSYWDGSPTETKLKDKLSVKNLPDHLEFIGKLASIKKDKGVGNV